MSSDELKDDESLNLFSSDFNPLVALYASNVSLPRPNAPILDNLSRFELSAGGDLMIKETKLPKKNEKPAIEEAHASTSTQPPVGQLDKKNVLCFMDTVEGPMAVLRRWKERRIRIKVITRDMSGVRGHLEAYIVAFDKMWNLALEDVSEVWYRKVKKKSIPAGPPSQRKCPQLRIPKPVLFVTRINKKMERCEREVAKVMMRGEHIVTITAAK